MRVAIAAVRIDGGTQPRTEVNTETVREYAELMAAGTEFPPVDVFFDGVDYWLADGFHRVHAARSISAVDVPATVHAGTKRDAVLWSVGANQAHGLKRTNADKRKAVLTLLGDPEWSQWSDREIARKCGVNHETVGKLRPSSLAENASEKPKTYTTKHGTTATMKTENIGRGMATSRSHAESAPSAPELAPRSAALLRPDAPPASGLFLARLAIRRLEEITPNDIERTAAFALVKEWLDAREA